MARRRPPHPTDFRLVIAPHSDTVRQIRVTRVILETTQTFASFPYELSVRETREGRHLTYTVLGLRTPKLTLAGAGPARYVRDYDDLGGTLEVTVVGLDGEPLSTTVSVSPEGVEILTPPPSTLTVATTLGDNPIT